MGMNSPEELFRLRRGRYGSSKAPGKADLIGDTRSSSILCLKARISRSRLSDIELGHITVTPEEISRIETALEQLIDAKRQIRILAEEVGWPVATV